MTTPVLAVLLPALAAPATLLELGSRTELRVRSPSAFDAEEVASVGLRMSFSRVNLGLEYKPVLTFTDLDSDPLVDFFNQGSVVSEFAFERLRLELAERLAYGTRNFAGLTSSTYDLVYSETGTQIVPVDSSVDYATSDTSLGAVMELSRRVGLAVKLGYLVDGGINDRSRRVVPQVRGPRATLDLNYALTRTDTVTAALEGETVHTDVGSVTGATLRTDIARGLARWGRSWDERMRSEIAAGAALVHEDPPIDGGSDVYPVLEGSLQRTFVLGPERQLLELGGIAQLDVMVDRLTGLPDHRASGSVNATWLRHPWELSASTGFSKSLGTAVRNDVEVIDGNVAARYELTRAVTLEAGFRSQYQIVESPTSLAVARAASGFNWVTYGALVIESPAWPL